MRKLFVLSEHDLQEDTIKALSQRRWSIVYAKNLKTAQALFTQEKGPLVGIVVFPEHRTPGCDAYLKQQVIALTQIKWIAAITQEQLSQEATKQFVAEHLYDFHVLPLCIERLVTVLGRAYGMARLEQELASKREVNAPNQFGLIGESPVMHSLYRMLQRAGESDVPVLITGPTGSGKELAARAVHDHSSRSQDPYVAINCAALSPSLLQSELFGHEKGAFTSANASRSGYIQSAAGGTLFLDEIGDMPMESQATLLRFLEDKIVTPIGSVRGKHVDVRVVASTNVDLARAIQDKTFRADLYYRLAFLTIQIPRLSERGDDIVLLANYFLGEATIDAGMRGLRISAEALAVMRHYAWPGNVRELRSAVFQAAINCEGLTIRPSDLKIPRDDIGAVRCEMPQEPAEKHDNVYPGGGRVIGTLRSARARSEKRNLEYALERNASNVTRTAQELGVSRMTLYRLMAKHGVERQAGRFRG